MIYTVIAVVAGLVAGSIYAIWKSHEERKADRRFEQRMKATYRPVNGAPKPPRAAGTKHSRIA